MIKTQNLVPDVYYNESRDFQLFGRAYDITFNYLKTNIDLITNRKDSKLLELLLRTVGFQTKRQYNYNDLYILSQNFIDIMRNKGTTEGIDKAIKTILHAENIKSKYEIYMEEEDGFKVITLYIDADLNSSEVALLEEILDYILPIGTLYSIKSAKLEKLQPGLLKVREAAKLSKLNSSETSSLATIDESYIDESVDLEVYEKEGLNLTPYNTTIGDLSLGTIIRDEDSDE